MTSPSSPSAVAHRPLVQSILTSLTAGYSFALGAVFLLGASDKLPPLLR